MSSRLQRPGPLRELPIELFAPAETLVIPSSPFKPSSKRSRSPSGLKSPMSPAKRRILNDEGVLSSPKASKSPEPHMSSEPLLLGLLSPRKLDFRLTETELKTPSEFEPHKIETPSTPRAKRISGPIRKLAPSPELVSSPPIKRREKSSDSSDSSFSTLAAAGSPDPSLQGRDLSPFPDRQCSHYPGFDVHRDTFSERLSSATRRATEEDAEEDDAKENVPPKRRPRTIVLEAPAFVKREGVASTPRRLGQSKTYATPQSVTPKVPRFVASPRIGVMPPPPFAANRSPDKAELKDRRRAMEEEADEAASDGEAV